MKTLCAIALSAMVMAATTLASAQNAGSATVPKKTTPAAAAAATQPAYKGPSPEDLQKAESIKADIAAIEKQIAEAQAESAKYEGGLIKARIDARIAQMKYTVSLLQTRQKALEVGARPTPVEVVASTVDEDLVAQLDKQIEQQRAKMAETQAKAAQYSGGLIQAQLLSTSATIGETLALLEQRRLVAKYGLAAAPARGGGAEARGSEPARPKVAGAGVVPLADSIIKVRLISKQYQEGRFEKGIFFDGEYIAEGLDKPARSIKGTFKVNDLFGETKLPIKWTITAPLLPGQGLLFSGKGIDYNQFKNEHQWLRSTDIADMKAVFSVESILYEDGTRRDF